MDFHTIHDLMASHGYVEDMIFFAELMKGTPYFIANCDSRCNNSISNNMNASYCITANIISTHLYC